MRLLPTVLNTVTAATEIRAAIRAYSMAVSAVSGGNYDYGGGNVQTSQITIIGNLIFDCDNAATAKQGNFYAMLNNTIVHTTKTGGLDTASGVVNVRDLDPGPPTSTNSCVRATTGRSAVTTAP